MSEEVDLAFQRIKYLIQQRIAKLKNRAKAKSNKLKLAYSDNFYKKLIRAKKIKKCPTCSSVCKAVYMHDEERLIPMDSLSQHYAFNKFQALFCLYHLDKIDHNYLRYVKIFNLDSNKKHRCLLCQIEERDDAGNN